MSGDEADRVIRSLNAPTERALAAVIRAVGIRVSDARGIRAHHIELSAGETRIIIAGGKNHCGSRNADTARLPHAQMDRWLIGWLRDAKRSLRPGARVFPVTLKKLNQSLQRTSGKRITSYSLRRLRLREIIDEHTNGRHTDWTAVAAQSMHKSTRALKSTYQN